jgi:hypothetical protein
MLKKGEVWFDGRRYNPYTMETRELCALIAEVQRAGLKAKRVHERLQRAEKGWFDSLKHCAEARVGLEEALLTRARAGALSD